MLRNSYTVFKTRSLPLNMQTCLHSDLKQTNRGHFWEQRYLPVLEGQAWEVTDVSTMAKKKITMTGRY